MSAPTCNDFGNAREQLAACADWLGWQDESLSYGLKSPADGLRLWAYWYARQDTLAEFADSWTPKERRAALGYDPLDGKMRSGGDKR